MHLTVQTWYTGTTPATITLLKFKHWTVVRFTQGGHGTTGYGLDYPLPFPTLTHFREKLRRIAKVEKLSKQTKKIVTIH